MFTLSAARKLSKDNNKCYLVKGTFKMVEEMKGGGKQIVQTDKIILALTRGNRNFWRKLMIKHIH